MNKCADCKYFYLSERQERHGNLRRRYCPTARLQWEENAYGCKI